MSCENDFNPRKDLMYLNISNNAFVNPYSKGEHRIGGVCHRVRAPKYIVGVET